jgi:hypothetical protein
MATCKPFDVKDAIELIVSTSARVGNPVELNFVLAALRAAFPDLRVSTAALQRELTKVADAARVLVNSGSRSPHPTSLASAAKLTGVLKPSTGRAMRGDSLAA